jgi:choice-of-anchor A domain-containing protein
MVTAATLALSSLAVIGAAAVSVGAQPAGATATCGGSLGQAGAFNEFSIQNATRSNSDVQGRAAYGGNASVNSFSFGAGLPINASRDDLIVGGNLSIGSGGGQLQSGSGIYAGTLSGPGTLGHPHGTLTHQAPPFSFATEGANLSSEAAAISALTQNGTVSTSGVGYVVKTLTGTDPTQNVFSLTAAQLAGANELDLKVPFTASSASTTLINVIGDYSVTTKPLNVIKIWNGTTFEQDGGSPSTNFQNVRARLLFNFSSSNVTIATNMAWEGTILAPQATVTIGQGQTNGGVIGNVINGTGQTNNALFDPNGCLPPGQSAQTPEAPLAVGLPLAAAVLLGGFWTVRRRRTPAAVLAEQP